MSPEFSTVNVDEQAVYERLDEIVYARGKARRARSHHVPRSVTATEACDAVEPLCGSQLQDDGTTWDTKNTSLFPPGHRAMCTRCLYRLEREGLPLATRDESGRVGD